MEMIVDAQAWLESAFMKWKKGTFKLFSPFITQSAVELLRAHLERHKQCSVEILVNPDPVAIALGALDISALGQLRREFPDRVTLKSVSNLHAKVLLFERQALYGSANFTHGGLVTNVELGTSINRKVDLDQLREIIDRWPVRDLNVDLLSRIYDENRKLRELLESVKNRFDLPVFEHPERTYLETVIEILKFAKAKGLTEKELIQMCRSMDRREADEHRALVRRKAFFNNLELLSIQDGKLRCTQKGASILHKNGNKKLADLMLSFFPTLQELLDRARTFDSSVPRVELAHGTRDYSDEIRWGVALGMLHVTKGSAKNIRAVRVHPNWR